MCTERTRGRDISLQTPTALAYIAPASVSTVQAVLALAGPAPTKSTLEILVQRASRGSLDAKFGEHEIGRSPQGIICPIHVCKQRWHLEDVSQGTRCVCYKR